MVSAVEQVLVFYKFAVSAPPPRPGLWIRCGCRYEYTRQPSAAHSASWRRDLQAAAGTKHQFNRANLVDTPQTEMNKRKRTGNLPGEDSRHAGYICRAGERAQRVPPELDAAAESVLYGAESVINHQVNYRWERNRLRCAYHGRQLTANSLWCAALTWFVPSVSAQSAPAPSTESKQVKYLLPEKKTQ